MVEEQVTLKDIGIVLDMLQETVFLLKLDQERGEDTVGVLVLELISAKAKGQDMKDKTIYDLIEDGYGSGSGNGHGFGVFSPFRGYGDGEYSCGGFDDAQGFGCGQGDLEGDKFFQGSNTQDRISSEYNA